MPTNITRDQVETWLKAIADGLVLLDRDNEGMARAALAYIVPAPPTPDDELPPGYLTPNFTLQEMVASDTAAMRGIDNTPNDDETDNLTGTCELLENVRALCGDNPLIVTSGFRCGALNQAVGGASNSAHLYGCAADFTVPGFGSVLDTCRAIEPHLVEWGVDQLIYENESWVHIGLASPGSEPRAQCLTINSAGTFNGIVA